MRLCKSSMRLVMSQQRASSCMSLERGICQGPSCSVKSGILRGIMPLRHATVISPSLARIISNPRVQAHAHVVLVIKGRAVEPRKASEAYPQQRKCVGRNCVRRGGLALNAQGVFQQCAQETGACKAGPFANLPPLMPAHVLRLLILQVTPVTCWQRGHRIAVRIGPARAAARRFKCWCALMLAGQCSFWDP